MTINANDLHGAIAAVVTPFRDDQSLNPEGLQAIVEYVVAGGVGAVMTTGGTGEFPSLSRDERAQVAEVAVKATANRVPVVAGTAACSTREVVALCHDALDVGADAVIVTAPFYFPLPAKSLYEHYATVARDAGLPVVVYNSPLYTGNDLSPDLLLRLLELPGVIGIKESNADLGQLVEIVAHAPAGRSICTGIDSQYYPALAIGAHGIYSTGATVLPDRYSRLYDLVIQGRHEEARALQLALQPLNRFFEYDPGYVSPAKEALRQLGYPAGPVRKPLPDITEDERAGIRKALVDLGALPAEPQPS
jgi:4-hydroxy-tetrahydrodipicolinate synthase